MCRPLSKLIKEQVGVKAVLSKDSQNCNWVGKYISRFFSSCIISFEPYQNFLVNIISKHLLCCIWVLITLVTTLFFVPIAIHSNYVVHKLCTDQPKIFTVYSRSVLHGTLYLPVSQCDSAPNIQGRDRLTLLTLSSSVLQVLLKKVSKVK